MTSPRTKIAVALALLIASAQLALAQSGTWINTAGGSWPTVGDWNGGTVADGADNTADFSTLDITADATVTLDGTRTIGNLIFGDATTPSNNWILNTGGGGPLTLDVTAGTPTITVNNQTATIGADIVGNDGLIKAGAGTLAFSTQKTYTGGTTVNAGILDLTGGASGGQGVIRGTATVNSGGTLQLSTGDATGYNTDSTRLSTINLNGGTLHVNTTANQTLGSATINMTGASLTGIAGSNLDLFANGSAINTLASATQSTISIPSMNLRQDDSVFTVADGAAAIDLLISSNIGNGSGGNHNMIKNGAGLMQLSGANSFTGSVTVNAGVVQMAGSSTPLGAENTAVTKVVVNSGGTVDLNGVANRTYGFTIAGTGAAGTGAMINTGGAINNGAKQATNLKLSANATIGGSGNWALLASGYAATNLDLGGFTLTKAGGNSIGFVTTTATAGTIDIQNGTVDLGYSAGGGSGVTAASTAVTLANTAGAGLIVSKSSSIGSLSGGGATGGNVSGSATLTVGGLNTNTSYAGSITGGSLTKTGTGTLTLTGNNTAKNAYTVNSGILAIASGGGIYRGGYSGDSGGVVLTVNSTGTLELQNWQYNINTGSLGGLSANQGRFIVNGGTVRMNNTVATTYGRAVNVGANGATLDANGSALWTIDIVNDSNAWVYTGNPTLTLTGAGDGEFQKVINSGTGGLIKDGSGTWNLKGVNTYSGGTTISAGTLLVNNSSGSGTGSGSVSVIGGATLGGDGTITGSVSLAASAILAPGNSPGSLSTGTLSLDSGSILNWQLDAPNQGDTVNSDRVDVTGNLTLGGILNVSALAGFGTPVLGDTWRLFNYTVGLTNNGLTWGTLPSLSGGLSYAIDTGTTGEVNLTVVPEPGSFALLLFGSAMLWRLRKRSR